MKELSVELESRHIEQLDSLQGDYNASSQSETLRQILDDHEARCTECEELSTQLGDCEEQLLELEEKLNQQTNIKEKLEKVAGRAYGRSSTPEPEEKRVFRPFLGRIAAIYVVGIFGVFAFFAREGLSTLVYRGWGFFLRALWRDITSPIDFITTFYHPILTLVGLLSLVTPIMFLLYTSIPETIDNRLAVLVNRVKQLLGHFFERIVA